MYVQHPLTAFWRGGGEKRAKGLFANIRPELCKQKITISQTPSKQKQKITISQTPKPPTHTTT